MHHAQLLLGSYAWACTVLPESDRVPGTDVVHLAGDRMGIEDVRDLIREAYLMPIVSTERVFMLAYGDITREAQNALLKILEEPPTTARFYLVVPRKETLLPTLKSRLVLYAEEAVATDTCDDFFRLSLGDQLKEIGVRLGKKDDEWAGKILSALEDRAYTNRKYEALRCITELRGYFDSPSASRKMILEHLVLMS